MKTYHSILTLIMITMAISLIIEVQADFTGVLLFSSDRDGDNELYLMYADSSDFVKLTDNSWEDVGHGWSPDATQIAFSSNRDGNYEIYIMDANGSNQTRLTNRPASYDFQPRWSPDGSKLVFTSETYNNSDIYSMNCDGTNIQQLTDHPAYHASPGWSPDGEYIVFDSQRTGNADIYIMESDGTNIQNITNTSGIHDISPMWSPVGNKIAYQKEVGDHWEIMIYDVNNNTIEQLTYIDADNQQPAWSNDGSQLVIMTRQDPGPNHDLYIIDITGDNLQQLTNNPAQDWYPAFKPVEGVGTQNNSVIPNGAKILYNSPNPFNPETEICFQVPADISEEAELVIYNLKGQKVKFLPINQSLSDYNRKFRITWNGTDDNNDPVSSGIYFCQLKVNESTVANKKMLLMK
ncbi:TolB family protein [Candidatus Cloacimonadota bacterium]